MLELRISFEEQKMHSITDELIYKLLKDKGFDLNYPYNFRRCSHTRDMIFTQKQRYGGFEYDVD